MQEHSLLPDFNDDDVCSFGSTMFSVGKFRQAVKKALEVELEDALTEELKYQGVEIVTKVYDSEQRGHLIQPWFTSGVDCQMLRVGGKSWKKGKVTIRVNLEFCPQEEIEPDLETKPPSGKSSSSAKKETTPAEVEDPSQPEVEEDRSSTKVRGSKAKR